MRVSLVVSLAAAIGLQQSSPPQPPPVFRSGTRLVQVNVVVHKKSGEPVADLKKGDFTILERGKPQEISFFSIDVAAPPPPASSSAPAVSAALLPSHTFTNVFAAREGVPTSVTVVLLDLLNAPPGDQMRARDGVIKFLREQLDPQDRVAIFAMMGHGLALLHDYTTDSAALVERLRNVKSHMSTDLGGSMLDSTTQKELRDMGLDALADAEQRAADFAMADRISNSISVFKALAEHMAGIPGRKNLVWVSSGFPLSIDFDDMPEVGSAMTRDKRIFTPEMSEAIRTLNDSGIAVYPVDARGIFNPVIREADIAAPSRRDWGKMPSTTVTSSPTSTMFVLADRTGGRFAYNTNDVAGAIRGAMDDARVTYTLGYYPADETHDGKFREIKVSVNRPGTDVRARKGYFATREVDRSANTRLREIQGAVWSPIDATVLPVTAEVHLTGEHADTMEALVQVDPKAVSFKKDGDRWKAELDMAFVQKDAHGLKQGTGGLDNLSIVMTEDSYKKVMEQGLIHRYRGAREPGATTLRIVVRDANTASLGSVTVPLNQIQRAGGLP